MSRVQGAGLAAAPYHALRAPETTAAGLDDEVSHLGPQDLRTPARLSLLLGAFSLLPIAVEAGRAEATSLSRPARGSLVAGSAAAESLTSGLGAALWVMWAVALLMWVLPALRLNRLDRATQAYRLGCRRLDAATSEGRL